MNEFKSMTGLLAEEAAGDALAIQGYMPNADGKRSDGRPRAETRIITHEMAKGEAEALRAATDAIGPAFALASPEDQVRIASFLVSYLRLTAPNLSAFIGSDLDGAAIRRVCGLPVGGGGDRLMATVLSLLRGGEIFQYAEQLGGQLTAPIEPSANSAPNSNASPEPFGWHCDDSIMPTRFRVEEIALLSVFNPAGTLTGFALMEDLL